MNVSSVKNLNGETFSAVQDATLTDVVQTNSGNWQDITAYQSNSANYLTSIPSDLDLNNISANNVVFKDINETFQGEVSTALTASVTDFGWANVANINTTDIGYSSDNMKISADLPITGTGYFDIGVHQEYNEHFGSWRVPYDQINLMNTLQINEYSSHFQQQANSLTGSDNITQIVIADTNKNTLAIGEANFVVSYPGIVTQPITFSSFYTNYGNTSAMLSGAIDYVSANAGGGGGVFPASADEAIQVYQSNSASYLTAHQDISNLMPKSESANFYPMTGNPSGFINELPNTEEVEFEEIDLSSFATSSQISALSGAIDYVSANAGGGYNETVLWSGAANAGEFTLNETYKNFEKIGITHGCRWAPANRTFAEDAIFDSNLFNTYSGASIIATEMEMSNITDLNDVYTHFSITPITPVNDTKLKLWPSKVTFLQTSTANATVAGNHKIEDARTIYKIYGINRK